MEIKLWQKIAGVILIVILLGSVSSLYGKYHEEREYADILNTSLNAANNKITEMENTIKIISNNDFKTSISYIDKTNERTFNTIMERVIFPTELYYPNSVQAPNNLKINLAHNVSCIPTNNWVVVCDGTSLIMSHNSGISGKISTVRIEKQLKIEELQEVLKTFINPMPQSKDVKYSKLFIENYVSGEYAEVYTKVDGEDAKIKAGILGAGNTGILYTFLYKGDEDKTKDEVVDNMIKTIEVNGLRVKLE